MRLPAFPIVRSLGAALIALLLTAAVPAAGADQACYRPEELRADAEAKLATLLERAAVICTGVLNSAADEAWNDLRQMPEIADGLARAEAARATFYQRLYGGADWQDKWRKAESDVLDYASYVLLKSDFSVAGCTRLTGRLTEFKSGGWRAYAAAVDRIDLIARPQVRLCE